MSSPAGPLSVFIVENHPDTAKYLKAYLVQLGHNVQLAVDMESALKELAATKADFLLSDIGLPDGDGWTLMERLPEESRPLFAVAMSGFGMNADRTKSLRVGFRNHLLKPFMPEDLDDLLQQAAREKEMRQSPSESPAPATA
ncbi:MAG TPA: response regulator [Chthoniobacterales bacterium]|jgi:two-component system CheB/CheR fusion protein